MQLFPCLHQTLLHLNSTNSTDCVRSPQAAPMTNVPGQPKKLSTVKQLNYVVLQCSQQQGSQQSCGGTASYVQSLQRAGQGDKWNSHQPFCRLCGTDPIALTLGETNRAGDLYLFELTVIRSPVLATQMPLLFVSLPD